MSFLSCQRQFLIASWNQLGFQEAIAPIIIYIYHFYDHGIIILTLIIRFVGVGLIRILSGKYQSRLVTEAQIIEIVWTLFPAIILIRLAIPSLRLLYLMDEIINPSLSIKAIGHQWYWSYEYPNHPNKLNFDSYINNQLKIGDFRLLEVDNRLVLPLGLEVRVLVSSTDVIHSWTVPSLGVKIDAVPGRSNQLIIISIRPGVFYGQCSEICGANHSFIPIRVEVIPPKWFKNWMISKNLW